MMTLLVKYSDGDMDLNKELGALNIVFSISSTTDFASLGSMFPTRRIVNVQLEIFPLKTHINKLTL